MKQLLAKYLNGNVLTRLYDDGTRIRMSEDDFFRPSFAENVDVHISNRCDNGCKMCYANCTPDGRFGNLSDWHFLDTLHRGTEMALNLNFPMPDNIYEFLELLKSKGIIANVTVNQNHFMAHEDVIEEMYERGLIHGVGISLGAPTKEFIERIQKYPNAVIHVINGLFTEEAYNMLKDNNLKVLILGYKDVGRGVAFHKDASDFITNNMNWLYDSLETIIPHFKVISFDNLSLKQLQVKRLLSESAWNEFYGGDDGTFTFFINLVEGYFAKNSLSDVHYPIGDLSMDEMFKTIVENNEGGMV